jgi:alkaline phosphatase D
MTQITRRSLLGASSAVLAACTQQAKSRYAPERVYEGEVAFRHGVASGDPLPDRIILWTRLTPLSGAGPIPVRWEVLEDGAAGPVASGVIEASEARDFCIKADATGLRPGAFYRYRFIAHTGLGDIISPEGQTRTAHASGEQDVRFAIVSCSNWQFGRFNAYRAIASEPLLDAVIHLGDYLYEYGVDAYGGEVGAEIGRLHEPSHEMIALGDYRKRHAQYKTDPDLQAAHASAPWICTWDDHETANDAYATGAENHQPQNGEGDWSARKAIALQAYMEWMPIREPQPGNAASAVWRQFRFGDVANLFAVETRLTGRSPSKGWESALASAKSAADAAAKAQGRMAEMADPKRTMLGAAQEAWLEAGINRSVMQGVTWAVLANQVIMARVKLPDLVRVLTPEQIAAQTLPEVKMMVPFSQLGLPANLDAWDGYPAARERLLNAVGEANARFVALAGDTHTAYANRLTDDKKRRRGVEFGCTSVTSPGAGAYVNDVPNLGKLFADANEDIVWHDPFGHGYTIVTLTRDRVRADFRKVSSILETGFDLTTAATFEAVAEPGGVSELRQL